MTGFKTPINCLPACLFACLPVCFSVCLPACLLICLSACLPVYLSAYCLSACLPLYLPAYCLSACLPLYLPAYCLSACLPLYLPCLPAFLSNRLPASLFVCLFTTATKAALYAHLYRRGSVQHCHVTGPAPWGKKCTNFVTAAVETSSALL